VGDRLLRAPAEQPRQPIQHRSAAHRGSTGHAFLGEEREQNTSRSVARGVVERHTDGWPVAQTQAAESVLPPEWLVIDPVDLDRRLTSPCLHEAPPGE